MDALLRFRVLGPLEVSAAGEVVPIGAGKQRIILAALLLRGNHTVSLDELIDEVWDGPTSGDARGTVQKYVMRLRRLLEGRGLLDEVIRTEPEGYRIVLSPGQLDLDRFSELTADAARAASISDAVGESALLTEALGLWRGVPPLSNVPSVSLHRHEVAAMTERYLQVLDRRIEVDLSLGRHAELIGELTGLVRRYPGRERFWAHRMRALHGAGRQGEALSAYREVARMLLEELGVDPGPELRAAHREILDNSASASTSPSARPSAPAAAGPRRPGPVAHQWRPVRQLPRAIAGFVGRAADLARVVGQLEDRGPHSDAPVVLTGLAGSGKTTLAVRAAHRVADQFRDGQLFADLRGHATAAPLTVAEVLGQFLRALGLPPGSVPAGEDERVLAYRSLLAGRRMLVVLDDAANVNQVRPLLPGASGCAVLITSRDALEGLTVCPGARRSSVGMLDAAEARELLVGVLGAHRVAAEAAAANELVALCGGLALALRVAAANLATQPGLDLADYVEQLRRGDLVSSLRVEGDDQANLAAAFAASIRRLEPDNRRLLQVLCHVSGPYFTVQAAAAAAGIPDTCAAAGAEALAMGSLLERLPAQRYRMHELIRAYVSRLDEEEDDAAEQAQRSTTVVRPLLRANRRVDAVAPCAELAVPASAANSQS